jgi:hypothetical protein
MTLRQRLLAMAGALLLLAASLSGGRSQHADQASISITILPGSPLVASLSNPLSDDVVAASRSLRDHDESGTLVLTVVDLRGLANGWTIQVAAQDFSSSNGHIGAGSLALHPERISVLEGNPDLTGHSLSDPLRASTTGMTLWSTANQFGDGAYDLSIDVAMTLPGNAVAGIYTVMLTIGSSAP